MEKFKWKKNNHGSTLLLVVVAIAFIGVLSSIVLSMTMINYQMKTIAEQSEVNFYSAEETMQEIKGSIEEFSAEALTAAYDEVLRNYADYTKNSKNISFEFDRIYLTKMRVALAGDDFSPNYNVDLIKARMSDGKRGLFKSENGQLIFQCNEADPSSKRYLILKDIKVSQENENDKQLTTIKTDLVIHSPGMSFATHNKYPEFTKYAIIANDKLSTKDSNSSSQVNGNIYAGKDGVVANDGLLKLLGNMLITRGDIEVRNDTTLVIGDGIDSPSIYTENIVTNKGTNSNEAKLDITGKCYVSNDLVLNAVNSKVTVNGTYQGFSYNKSNTVSDSNPNNANFSSSIIINGKNCSIDLSGLSSLLLAGRTFISRSATGSPSEPDIAMGQGIGVKSNQTMYLVPEKYLRTDIPDKTLHNPMTKEEYEGAITSGKPGDILDTSLLDPGLASLLSVNKVTSYYYQLDPSLLPIVYFYWEFKDVESANSYFDQYISDPNSDEYKRFESQMATYLESGNKIILNDSMYIKNSSSLFCYKDGKFKKVAETSTDPFDNMNLISDDKLKPLRDLATLYKERQLYLGSTGSGGDPNIRLEDKSSNPIFESIISQEGSQSVIAKEAASGSSFGFDSSVKKIILNLDSNVSTYEACVAFIDNPSSAFYISNLDLTDSSGYCGIVVATGNIIVNTDFEGLIIAGGEIQLYESTVTADIDLVRSIINYGVSNYNTAPAEQKFLHYFTQFQAGVGGGFGSNSTVDLASSIEYENWVRNYE